MDLKVLSPLPDLIDTTYLKSQDALYSLLHDLVQEHKTTLIFTNTRAATERVVHTMKEMYKDKYVENIGAHHGSLSKAARTEIEQGSTPSASSRQDSGCSRQSAPSSSPSGTAAKA